MGRYCRLFQVFEVFSCMTGDPHVFSRFGIKVAEVFPIIRNLAVTTRITINYSRSDFFLKWILKSKQYVKLPLDLKIFFSLQYGKSLSMVRLSLVLKSNESLPKFGKTTVNSLLGTIKLSLFLINNLYIDSRSFGDNYCA